MKPNKFLHILPYWIATNSTLNFFDNFTLEGEHSFCVFAQPSDIVNLKKDLTNIKPFVFTRHKHKLTNTLKFIKLIRQYDNVILHSLGTVDNLSMIYTYIFHRHIIKKISWIEFGGDFYIVRKNRNGLKQIIWGKIYKLFLKRIPNIISIFEGDTNIIKSELPNANVTFIPYSFTDIPQKPSATNTNSLINILISHRYREYVHYKEILSKLSKHENKDDFNIIIPLFGAPKQKAIEITELAKSLFKNVTTYINNIPNTEYNSFLDNISIAIIDCEAEQQVALGTINKLLIFGKKVYLPQNNIMYQCYKSKGIKLYDIESIGLDTLQKEEIDNSQAIEYFNEEIFNKVKKQNKWNAFFKQLANR